MPVENQIVRFELFRYQLLPLTQNIQADLLRHRSLEDISTVDELRANKNKFFQRALSDLPPIRHRDAQLNYRVDLNNPPWFVFELNTEKSLERELPNFSIEQIENWPHVTIIINNEPEIQIIAISINQKAFSSGSVVARLLQDNLQTAMQDYFLTIQIEALFEKNKFWQLVEEYKKRITCVNFELISPNMSNISKKLELDLARLNSDTNSHRTNLKLNSNKGSTLEIKESNPLVNSLVEYSSEGGGDIELRIKGLRKTIRTSKTVREISIDELSLKNLNADTLRILMSRFYDGTS